MKNNQDNSYDAEMVTTKAKVSRVSKRLTNPSFRQLKSA